MNYEAEKVKRPAITIRRGGLGFVAGTVNHESEARPFVFVFAVGSLRRIGAAKPDADGKWTALIPTKKGEVTVVAIDRSRTFDPDSAAFVKPVQGSPD